MLLEFRVSNYRSIGEEQIISLIPAPKQKDYLENIITSGKYQALNAISIYGPNNSGKSNLLLAMSLLDKLIHVSARTSSTTPLPFDPFLLREGWPDKPTFLGITFLLNQSRYRYGIEFTKEAIQTEWLYRKNEGREVRLFDRKNEIIDVGSGFNGSKKLIDAAIEATRDNALFLSMCDMLNIEEAKSILLWFKNFNMVNGLDTQEEEMQTVSLWEDSTYKEKIKKYLELLCLNIVDIDITTKEFDNADLPDDMPKRMKNQVSKQLKGAISYSVLAKHQTYNKDGTIADKPPISWKWDERESSGAQKAFDLSGPVIWALHNGGVLIVDEIEAKMHPIMTMSTIDLFLNKESNPQNAQLIFATHDTNLLTYSSLRRDQICFTEKNEWQSTELYSLSDFVYFQEKDGTILGEKERPDIDKEKRYFEGRYKAIPILESFKNHIRNGWQKEE